MIIIIIPSVLMRKNYFINLLQYLYRVYSRYIIASCSNRATSFLKNHKTANSEANEISQSAVYFIKIKLKNLVGGSEMT